MSDFYKYHGLGNDYIVIDPAKCSVPMTEENIKLICHRNLGVGSDGILYGPIKKSGGIHLKIFNPDGSEAEKSGNGLRIFAQYLWDQKYVTYKSFHVHTKVGPVEATILDEHHNLIKIDMGELSFTPQDIPIELNVDEVINHEITLDNKSFKINCVSIGNPHCVIIADSVSKELATKYGQKLETYKLFPNRTNVQFVQVIDRKNIKIEIWERGAGYTLASGSSSVGATAVAHKHGLIDSNVTVHMAGGNVNVKIQENRALLTGTVERVMEGKFYNQFHEVVS
jgi:diaminopimelate epimerase